MAWTARLREAKRSGGKWDVAIIYTDGIDTLVKGYQFERPDESAIRAFVRAEVDRLNATAAEVPTLVDGELIDLTPPDAPPAPTAAEIARAAWFADFHKLQRLFRLADVGLIAKLDARIVALQTSLKADWLNSYIDGI